MTDSTLKPHEFIQLNRYHMEFKGNAYRIEHYFFHHLSDEAQHVSKLKTRDQTVTFSDNHGTMFSLTTEKTSTDIPHKKQRLPLMLYNADRDEAINAPADALHAIIQTGIGLMVERDEWLLTPQIYVPNDTPSLLKKVVNDLSDANRQERLVRLAADAANALVAAEEREKAQQKEAYKKATKDAKKAWEERVKREAAQKNANKPSS